MSKKDYELIAVVLRNQYRLNKDVTVAGMDRVCADLAHALELTNPRFDRNKFLTACGHSKYLN